MKNNSVDLGAKLLASENITIVRAKVATASFDIKSRVLTLPQWKDSMTPEVEQMLLAHEVGHALYTTHEYIEPLETKSYLKSYMNIIEDVRIEKLIKRKYPGIRKIMLEGYKQLNEKDFFGLKEIDDLSSIKLIDKINLFFKAGYSCGVEFSEEEYEFVKRVEKIETIDEVIALAEEVYEYTRKLLKQQIVENLFSDADEDMLGGQSEDGGKSYQNSIAPEEEVEDFENSPELEQQLEEQLKPDTDENFSDKLEEMADMSTAYKYHYIDETELYDPIVSFKTVLNETKDVDTSSFAKSNSEEYAKFKVESNRVVSYLLKEFETKKSAQLYKRAQTSKVGSLDMKKIWSYKINEDLFKRVTTIPEGKNHGMIFLLDWSGSMDQVLGETIEQVINLALFCHRAQIPYQVFAFTSYYKITGENHYSKISDYHSAFNNASADGSSISRLSNNLGNMALLEFFSSKMSNVEFNTMARRLLSGYEFRRCPGYSTGGTPLNEALAYMLNHIPKFVQANNIEKMSFITLTDGQGSQLNCSGQTLRSYGYDYNANGISHRVRLKHFLADPVTKKNYEFSDESSIQTKSILQMIKDRYRVNVVGFYICSNNRNALRSAVTDNIPGSFNRVEDMVDRMREQFRSNGFASLENSGRDDLFIVPHNKLTVESTELEVNSEQNARQIAKNFTKTMSGRKTSRVLLNRFIQYVA